MSLRRRQTTSRPPQQSAFVFGVYFYTMRTVGGTDELQTAIYKFEQQKRKEESEATIPSKA